MLNEFDWFDSYLQLELGLQEKITFKKVFIDQDRLLLASNIREAKQFEKDFRDLIYDTETSR